MLLKLDRELLQKQSLDLNISQQENTCAANEVAGCILSTSLKRSSSEIVFP